MTERLFWIDLHFACIWIVAVGDIVTVAPPIAAWMKGKSLKEIKPYLLAKKAVMTEIKPTV